MDEDALRRSQFVPHKSLPFAVERADGAYLITPTGRRILDAAGGAIVANIGHGRREVAQVAAQAIEECSYVVPLFVTPYRARLVERLRASWLPQGLSQCLFVSGGSESVEVAIRLARHHHLASGRPERWKSSGQTSPTTALARRPRSRGHANRRKG
jgi:adenosylmethionine-8-amino-7-oxononanoate aminotransferase